MSRICDSIFFIIVFVAMMSCGVNLFKGVDSKNPQDEQERIKREENSDPDMILKEAKKKLPDTVQNALNKIEDKIKSGTAYKDLKEEDLEELKESIPGEVKDSFKSGSTEKKEEVITTYTNVAQAYADTTEFNQIDFLEVIVSSSSEAKKLWGLTEETECPSGMDKFLDLAISLREEYCSEDGLKDLENLEMATLINRLLYTEVDEDGNYMYSVLIDEFEEGAVSEVIDTISQSIFNTYIQSLFFQIIYVACEFVTEDCTIDTSRVDIAEVQKIWYYFLLASPLESELKEKDLLPEASYSIDEVIQKIRDNAEEILTSECDYDDPVYCAIENYFQDIGEVCATESYGTGDCAL